MPIKYRLLEKLLDAEHTAYYNLFYAVEDVESFDFETDILDFKDGDYFKLSADHLQFALAGNLTLTDKIRLKYLNYWYLKDSFKPRFYRKSLVPKLWAKEYKKNIKEAYVAVKNRLRLKLILTLKRLYFHQEDIFGTTYFINYFLSENKPHFNHVVKINFLKKLQDIFVLY